MLRWTYLFLGLLASGAWGAETTFTPLPAEGKARVTITIGAPSNAFHMPAWAPGDYELLNYGKFLEQVEFRREGKVVPATQSASDPNTWRIEGGADAVSYVVNPSRGNFSVNLRVKADETFVSPPGVIGWFEGHALEKQGLSLDLVPPNARVFSTLDHAADPAAGTERLEAPNYDELIDAPFVMGTNVRSQEFSVRGKPHFIVAFGNSEGADLTGFASNGAAVAEQAARLFGELPYPRYIFFLDFGGGGGGLEHLNSTRIGLGSRASARGAVGIMFHEYFHAFNVKRIRPKPLGPFDYTRPAVTGALWWLEGVTDYYADLLEARAGLTNRQGLLASLGSQAASIDRHPARDMVSADASSRRVWEVRGSQGYGFSYYAKGKAIGLCLDLAIRGSSGGEHSLDDVIRALYGETTGGKPGFDEGRIRALCVQYGGPALGPIYDRAVMEPGPLPLADCAALAGMRWQDGRLTDDPAATADRRAIGAGWPGES
ncbi:MAG: hypothetical protein M9921_15620 [Fimbriimonadaceae bacterium]|nr:hypothetical protein [Fimbriimonadaceae bacterium]